MSGVARRLLQPTLMPVSNVRRRVAAAPPTRPSRHEPAKVKEGVRPDGLVPPPRDLRQLEGALAPAAVSRVRPALSPEFIDKLLEALPPYIVQPAEVRFEDDAGKRWSLPAALEAGVPVTVAMLLDGGIDRASARAIVEAIHEQSLDPIRWR
ncbi:MAG: hypothetical protein AB1938_05795 [Myxococcota bacterium]